MRRTRHHPLIALADNTLLAGLAGLAVGALLLFIAYKALTGIPGVPTYDVQAEVPDAAALTKGADVRIGGARVGQVLAIHPVRPGGARKPYARLDLRLGKHEGPLPADTTVEVRLASVLGGKYVALVPGHAHRRIAANGVIPLRHAIASVDVDQALKIFRPETRAALQSTLSGLGDALAGRGAQLNDAVGQLAQALPAADRVLRVLTDPATNLEGFVQGAAGAASALASVAGPLADSLGHGATTAQAIDDAGSAVDATLSRLPTTETEATRALVHVRPALADAAAIAQALRPGAHDLPASLREVDETMRTATPVARHAGTVAHPLDSAFADVDRFAQDPAASGSLKALGANDFATFGGSAFIGLGGILRSASDAQLNCNAVAVWMRNLASVASEGDSGGNWLRMVPIVELNQMLHADKPAAQLHANPYPHENASECEAGHEPYTNGQQLGNPPGEQSGAAEPTTRPAGVR
ncbi:MAG TPA: MlaD family protein [Solirubrobacteraceae bacterium]